MQTFIPMKLKWRLKQLRELHPNKPTQLDMANYLGIREHNYNRLEMMQTVSVKYETIEKLCDFFNCTPNDLFVIIEEKPITTEKNYLSSG